MFFQTFFFASGGAVLYWYGTVIRSAWDDNREGEFHREEYGIIIQFAGAGTAMLLYVRKFIF